MKQFTLGILSTTILVAMLIQPARAQSMELSLAPHGSKLIENTYGFALHATCMIHSDKKNSNTLRLNVVEKTGVVNGKHLTKGQSTSVVVRGQKALSVHANPGSKVNIQNLSDNAIQATCSV